MKHREMNMEQNFKVSYQMLSFYNFQYDWQVGLFNQIAFSDSVLFNEGALFFFFFDCIGNVEAFEELWCAIYSSIMLGISLISMSVE